jgi:hypothetical protein
VLVEETKGREEYEITSQISRGGVGSVWKFGQMETVPKFKIRD